MSKRTIVLLAVCIIVIAAIRFATVWNSQQPQEQDAPQTYTLAVLTEQVMVKLPGKNEFSAVTGESDVLAGTEIKTSSAGTAKLLYPNGTLVTLSPDTEIRLDTLDDNGNKSRIELITGGIWSRIKNILGPGEFYEIETDNTVASVRGTIFAIEYRQGITNVLGIENTIRVQARNPKLKKIIEGTDTDIKGGEKTTVNSNALPAPARQLVRQAIAENDYRRDFVRQQALQIIQQKDLSNEQVRKFVRTMKEQNATDHPFIQRMIERHLIDTPSPTPTLPILSPTPRVSEEQNRRSSISQPNQNDLGEIGTTPSTSVIISATPTPTQATGPKIESIVPSTASANAEITVNGHNFTAGRNVSQIRSVYIGDLSVKFFVLDSLTIFATINDQLGPGVYDVSIKDINGAIDILTQSLTIK